MQAGEGECVQDLQTYFSYTLKNIPFTAKIERLFQPSFGYLSFMPLCSASLNTRESHWLLYIPNSNGQFFRTFNLVNAEEGKY